MPKAGSIVIGRKIDLGKIKMMPIIGVLIAIIGVPVVVYYISKWVNE